METEAGAVGGRRLRCGRARRLTSWLVVAAVAGLVAPADGAPPSGRLVFEGGDGQVYISRLDGDTPVGLGDRLAGGAARRPSWSPDAKRVVYATQACGDPVCGQMAGQVVSVEVRTGAATVLVSLPQVFTDNASWSPDGSRVAFDVLTPGPYGQATLARTMVVGSTGSGLRTVTLGQAPAWAPDSRRLALTDWSSGALVVVDVDSGASTRVSPENVYSGPLGVVRVYAEQPSPPSWSPDGRRLAFSGVRSDTHAVVDNAPADWHAWVVGADGRTSRQLRDAGEVLRAPSWSPDSARVVFADAAGISVVGADGRMPRRIATARAMDSLGRGIGLWGPAWSPEGSLIAFMQQAFGWRYTPHSLRVVRPDGRALRVVHALEHGAVLPLRWAPDSTA